jgi:hypothetical protein
MLSTRTQGIPCARGSPPPPLSLPAEDLERQELRELLRTLGTDEAANAKRVAIATGLARGGRVMWVQGSLLRPHRVSVESGHGFGDDRVAGIATVAQIGGELARASIDLLRAGNRYAASALIRQLFEVEYLAHAFAGDHESAAAWLRADQQERREFWAPQKLRNRADGAFIDEHSGHIASAAGTRPRRVWRFSPTTARRSTRPSCGSISPATWRTSGGM